MTTDQTNNPPPTLTEIIQTLEEAEDHDGAHILAECINLYLLTIRRRGNRHSLSAEDVQRIFTIARLFLSASDLEIGLHELTGVPTKIARREMR